MKNLHITNRQKLYQPGQEHRPKYEAIWEADHEWMPSPHMDEAMGLMAGVKYFLAAVKKLKELHPTWSDDKAKQYIHEQLAARAGRTGNR